MMARGEVEKADGAISKAASKVGVRRGEATVSQPIRGIHVGLIEVECLVRRCPNTKIMSRLMKIRVFVMPRGLHEVGSTPYDACEMVPQWIRARDNMPRGTNLKHIGNYSSCVEAAKRTRSINGNLYNKIFSKRPWPDFVIGTFANQRWPFEITTSSCTIAIFKRRR